MLEKCDKILWLNLNFSKQNGLWFQANCISDNGSKNRSRKIIVPQCFRIQNRIHGFDVRSVHITNRIGKSYGTLHPVNTLLIGKVDLETMESCAPGLASWNFFCFFLLNKNYTLPVCSTVPANLRARGLRLKYRKMYISLSPLSLSRKSSPFFKNETCLIRGRNWIRVTQNHLSKN